MSVENCITAIVTPFAGGRVDLDAFDRLCAFQKRNGVNELVVNGTTGESPTTSPQEQDGLVEIAAKHCSVLAGTGSNSTKKTIQSSEDALTAGASGLLLVDPYYNGPSSMEIRQEYYEPVAERFDCRILPYIIPGRTGCELSPEDLVMLHSAHPNVFGVKEATGNMDRMRRERALSPSLAIYSGDDDITFAMMTEPAIRACGVVSVASNVAPAAVKRMCDLAASGRVEEAKALHDALSPLFAAITVKTVETVLLNGQVMQVNQKFRNPLAYKTLMAGLGMCEYGVRPPLGRMSRKGVEVVRSNARKVWESNSEVLEPVQTEFGVSIEDRLANDRAWVSYDGY
jgi:4-hydroxy-tetrahydrodipicolinate synthase